MNIDNGTLVMVLDGTKLLLLRNDGDEKYPVLSTLAHEETDNPPSREQGTDTPGRTHASMGEERSSYGETDWHEQSKQRFIRHAAEVLEKAATGQPEAGIVVIAPARALGELRKHYGLKTSNRLLAEIGKDLVKHMTDDITEAISAHNP